MSVQHPQRLANADPQSSDEPGEPRRRRQRRGAAAPSHPRGVALLLVLVGTAVLAYVASELRFAGVIDLRLATNQRDEVRAYYLARSGLALSRLMLRFQRQVDSIALPNLGPMLQTLLGALQPGGAPQTQNAAPPQNISLQLWRMAKVDCHLLQGLIVEDKFAAQPSESLRAKSRLDVDEENPEIAEKQRERSFGTFEGCFDSVISDEEEKINLNKLDAPMLAATILLQQTVTTFGDKKYEFLFEKEDSHRVKLTPTEVITSMRDWVDEDDVGTTLNFSGQGEPFQKGFSDEKGAYTRYDPRYVPKNARFDSLDELYQVHGVNENFMAAFRDRLTVYPDINSRLNINTDDPVLLELAIRSVADPARPDVRLSDPAFIDLLIRRIRMARVFTVFGMSVSDFVNIVSSAGVTPNPTIINNVQNQRFVGDKSTTYQVKVEGTAGDVKKTLTAVVRLDDGLGRLLSWRED